MKKEKDELTDFRWFKVAGGFKWVRASDLFFTSKDTDVGASESSYLMAANNDSPGTLYSPLLETGLFKTFADTPPEKKSMLEFANTYGPLGGKLASIVTSIRKTDKPLNAEPFTAWKTEITRMRTMLALWQDAVVGNTHALSRVIRWDEHGVRYTCDVNLPGEPIIWFCSAQDAASRFRPGDVVLPAFHVLQQHLNNMFHEHHIAPKMLWESGSSQLVMRISATSLIGMLWLQFAKAVEGNKQFRQCRQCRKWFEVGENTTARSDKKFCTPTCKSAAHRKGKQNPKKKGRK